MFRIFRHYVPKSLVLVAMLELAIFYSSVYFGVHFDFSGSNPTGILLVGPLWSKATVYAVFMFLFMAAMGLYARGLRENFRGILFRIGLAFAAGLLVMIAIIQIFPALSVGTDAFSIAFVYSAALIVLIRGILHEFGKRPLFRRRVLILGTGKVAAQVQRLRRRVDRRDMIVVGYVYVPGDECVIDPEKVLTIKTSLRAVAREHGVEEIVVAFDERRLHSPVMEVLECKMSGIKVMELMTFFEQQTGKIPLDGITPSNLIFADGFVQAVIKTFVHRAFDVAVSVIMLLLTLPVMLAVSVAIFLESGGRGPILYRQERIGRNGKRFQMLKFRSMRTGAEEEDSPRWAVPDDDRVTSVGVFIRKFRFDELPQLVNVLKGEMSFVGPRPERPEFVEELRRQIPYYDLRHRVNPGITGWAQIGYPYGASVNDAKEKLQYDLYYIKNYSLFLDLMILIQTTQVILWGRGAR